VGKKRKKLVEDRRGGTLLDTKMTYQGPGEPCKGGIFKVKSKKGGKRCGWCREAGLKQVSQIPSRKESVETTEKAPSEISKTRNKRGGKSRGARTVVGLLKRRRPLAPKELKEKGG